MGEFRETEAIVLFKDKDTSIQLEAMASVSDTGVEYMVVEIKKGIGSPFHSYKKALKAYIKAVSDCKGKVQQVL